MGTSGLVRASTNTWLHTWAVLVNIFWPLIDPARRRRAPPSSWRRPRPSPSRARCSRGRSAPRLAARPGRYSRFCSSVPTCSIVCSDHRRRRPAVEVQAPAGALVEDGAGERRARRRCRRTPAAQPAPRMPSRAKRACSSMVWWQPLRSCSSAHSGRTLASAQARAASRCSASSSDSLKSMVSRLRPDGSNCRWASPAYAARRSPAIRAHALARRKYSWMSYSSV